MATVKKSVNGGRKSHGTSKRVVSQTSYVTFPKSPLNDPPRKTVVSSYQPTPENPEVIPHTPGSLSSSHLQRTARVNNSRANQEANTGTVLGEDPNSGESLVRTPGSRVVRVSANSPTQGSQVAISGNQKKEEIYEKIRKHGVTVSQTSAFNPTEKGSNTVSLTSRTSVAEAGLLRDPCTPPDVKAQIIESAAVQGVYLSANGEYLGGMSYGGPSKTLIPDPLGNGREIWVNSDLASRMALDDLYQQAKQAGEQRASLPSYVSLGDLGGQSTVGFSSNIPKLWKCVNGSCVEADDGFFPTRELCESQCGQTSWNCINGTCVEVPGLSGAFKSQSECVNGGCNSRYSCSGGEPVPDPNGPFASLEAAIQGGCYWGWGKDSEGQCVPQIGGRYKSKVCCEDDTLPFARVYSPIYRATDGSFTNYTKSPQDPFPNTPNDTNYSYTYDLPGFGVPLTLESTLGARSFWFINHPGRVRLQVNLEITAPTTTSGPVGEIIPFYLFPQVAEIRPMVMEYRSLSGGTNEEGQIILGENDFPYGPFLGSVPEDSLAYFQLWIATTRRQADYQEFMGDLGALGPTVLSPSSNFRQGPENSISYPELFHNITHINGSPVTLDENQDWAIVNFVRVDDNTATLNISYTLEQPELTREIGSFFDTQEDMEKYRIAGTPGNFSYTTYGEGDKYVLHRNLYWYQALVANNFRSLQMRFELTGGGVYSGLSISNDSDFNLTYTTTLINQSPNIGEFRTITNFQGNPLVVEPAVYYPLNDPRNTNSPWLNDPYGHFYYGGYDFTPNYVWNGYYSTDPDWNPQA